MTAPFCVAVNSEGLLVWPQLTVDGLSSVFTAKQQCAKNKEAPVTCPFKAHANDNDNDNAIAKAEATDGFEDLNPP